MPRLLNTTTGTIPGFIQYFTFADGSTYHIASNTGTNFTLDTALSSAEASGQQVWANSTAPIAKVASAGAQPFNSFIDGNSMMSSATLTSCPSWDPCCTANPLKDMNALSNPPSASAGNNEPAENIVWSNNTYAGPWAWHTYKLV